MARTSNSNNGFTLTEILAVVLITGILASIAVPSLNKKTFARTVPQIEGTLKVVSLKARANTGNPYRITLQGTAPNQFLKVDYIKNGSCNSLSTAAWRQDPTQTLYLPDEVVISGFPAGGICFDGRGQASVLAGSAPGAPRSFDVTDSKRTSKATKATINVSAIGDISRRTFSEVGGVYTEILDGKFN
jgi:prepilin-type N-terminal cleavage/methylation domain-containing protein